VAAGVGLSPGPIWTIAVNVDRTHVSSQTTRDGRGVVSNFRGGTLTLGSAELRVVPFGLGRIGPYGIAGVAAGRSEPNVTDVFPQPAPNDVRAMFFGGGLNLPLGGRTRLFADVRWTIGADADNGLVAVLPVRAGLAWRF
jgi:hypothetical protein